MNDLSIFLIFSGFLVLCLILFNKLKNFNYKDPKPNKSSVTEWKVGPVINGNNHSVGVDRYPTNLDGGNFFIELPKTNGSLNSISTIVFNNIITKDSIIDIKFKFFGTGRVVAADNPNSIGTVSFMFQRKGDNWTGRDQYEYYRWYSPSYTVFHIDQFDIEYETSLNFCEDWTSVFGKHRYNGHNAEFLEALNNIQEFSIVFGGPGGRAHGVYATDFAVFQCLSIKHRTLNN